jgi:hypothetical protein
MNYSDYEYIKGKIDDINDVRLTLSYGEKQDNLLLKREIDDFKY